MNEMKERSREESIADMVNEVVENMVSEELSAETFEAQDELQEQSLEQLLDPRILRAIREMGFTKMSPIQEQAIPSLLEGKDIIGQAQTGTGKTAAFGIPLIQKIDPELRKLQAVVLCPTRELAIQAAEELRKLAKYMHSIKILPVYGGQEIGRQISGLRGVQIIVGTPGRVMDHMRRHTIKLDHVNMVVLDEADEMLNMGFREDMELILGEIPGEHQTALFSATMPKPILEITGKFQKDAQLIKVASKELTIPLVSQRFYRVRNEDKDAACIRLLEYYQPKLCLIFCNTKKKVDELTECLKQHDFQAEGLHGDMTQAQRDVAMGRFRNGSTNILIATDVAARGIDVDDVEAVINYDIPQDIEYYVHRIGRTGRAGRTGRSFTFAGGREIFRIREIERVCHTTIEEKRLPGAGKVMKVKAEKLLEQAWELKDSEDLDLMEKFLERKMEKEGCDAMELASLLLKYYVGDKGEEIPVDEPPVKFAHGRERDRRGSLRGRRTEDGRRTEGGRRTGDDRRTEGGRRTEDDRRTGDRRRRDRRDGDDRGAKKGLWSRRSEENGRRDDRDRRDERGKREERGERENRGARKEQNGRRLERRDRKKSGVSKKNIV